MKKILAVAGKEILDNLRDKRSLGFALLYPIFFPAYIALVFMIGSNIANISFEKETDLHVLGQDNAPNLIAYLEQNNYKVVTAPQNYTQAITDIEIPAVLEISDEYSEHLRAGLPAPVIVHMTESDNDSNKAYRKIRSVINKYARSINQRRLQVRGIDVNLFDSIDIQKEDVSNEGSSGRAQGLMVPMAIIISMIMGGFYLAIEVTAGEKEKHSLEPLLSLPVSRKKMVLGKYLALLAFCLISFAVALIGFIIVFEWIPYDSITDIFNFNFELISKVILILLPLALFVAALLMSISSFTKSTKEAQTYLGMSIFVFMAPFFVMLMKTIPSNPTVFATPILSQYKLLDKVFKDESLAPVDMLISSGTTTASAIALLLLAIWLYKQDRILQ